DHRRRRHAAADDRGHRRRRADGDPGAPEERAAADPHRRRGGQDRRLPRRDRRRAGLPPRHHRQASGMSFARRVAILSALYLAQGLPFGFQSFALQIFLRRQGVSLAALGFVSALSLPWLAKPLWAPLVDRFGATRRAWIVPLMLILAALCAAAAL